MKKRLLVAGMLAGIVMFVTPGFADEPVQAGAIAKAVDATALERIRGVIVSIDAARNQLVIREDKTSQERTLTADAKDLSALKVGDKVKARVKPGSDVAESIRKFVSRKKK